MFQSIRRGKKKRQRKSRKKTHSFFFSRHILCAVLLFSFLFFVAFFFVFFVGIGFSCCFFRQIGSSFCDFKSALLRVLLSFCRRLMNLFLAFVYLKIRRCVITHFQCKCDWNICAWPIPSVYNYTSRSMMSLGCCSLFFLFSFSVAILCCRPFPTRNLKRKL